MEKELEIAISAARQAGALLKSRFYAPHQVRHKDPANLVTEMDLMAEELISGIVLGAFPNYAFFGEEQFNKNITNADKPRWIVDPLDGTTNYAHGYPLFAVSIALEVNNEIVLGVVYNPLLDELFTGLKGKGAFLNGQPIMVSNAQSLGVSLVASGFPYDAWVNKRDNGEEWRGFLKCALSTRSDGSAALDLCHVAAGRIDGYWELDLEPWDMAAGVLIVQEAGGRVSAVDGSLFTPFKKSVLASNALIHDAMFEVLGVKRGTI